MRFLSGTQASLHGGQVVSWRNDRGEELLFTSSKVKEPPSGFFIFFFLDVVLWFLHLVGVLAASECRRSSGRRRRFGEGSLSAFLR